MASNTNTIAVIPPTRYQGSKRRLCNWLHARFAALDFDTALDAFGGTGAVSYLLKSMGKRVVYNDVLAANQQVGLALIENDTVMLTAGQLNRLLDPRSDDESGFIADTFKGIYFTDRENAWLDRTRARIVRIRNRYARAIAWYALLQSAIAKRPYNLFHRRNLYMRTAKVRRGFGNKSSWDRSFEDHFRVFVNRANGALIDSHNRCRVTRCDAVEVPGDYDLVYIDTPYLNHRGAGVDYHHFYHFLEGMLDYARWPERIDWKSKHLRLRAQPSRWTSRREIGDAFEQLFDRYRKGILAVSYRSDGIPPIETLVKMVGRHKRRVNVHTHQRRSYALSTNRSSCEVLIVGW